MKRLVLLAALVAALSVFSISSPGQCAMCVTALQNSAEGRVLAQSLGQGILFLLAMPYLIFGTAAYAVYRAYRRKSSQRNGVR
jgi:hypothetical protein